MARQWMQLKYPVSPLDIIQGSRDLFDHQNADYIKWGQIRVKVCKCDSMGGGTEQRANKISREEDSRSTREDSFDHPSFPVRLYQEAAGSSIQERLSGEYRSDSNSATIKDNGVKMTYRQGWLIGVPNVIGEREVLEFRCRKW